MQESTTKINKHTMRKLGQIYIYFGLYKSFIIVLTNFINKEGVFTE